MSQCHVHAVPGSDVPCPTPSHRCHRTIGFSRARIIVVPCVLTPQLPPWAIAHLTPYPLSSSLHSLVITLPLHFPSLCRFHTGPLRSFHVSFHDVRTKTFSAHVTTQIGPAVRETGLFTHGRASLNFTIIPMCTSDVAVPCHAMPGSDVPCPCTIAPSAPPARELLSCPVS